MVNYEESFSAKKLQKTLNIDSNEQGITKHNNLAEFFSEHEADTNLAGDRGCTFHSGLAVVGLWETPDPGHVSPWMASGPGTLPARPYGPHGSWGAAEGHGRSQTSWPAGSAEERHHPVGSWGWGDPNKSGDKTKHNYLLAKQHETQSKNYHIIKEIKRERAHLWCTC